jgi:hypothetical protein
MSDVWKTPKGTSLYLMNLKGKPYLPVAERLIWFREEHPDWTIKTEFLQLTDTMAIAKATIFDVEGRTIANAHKQETKQGFADFIEKSETGSIGRCLALIGYGTQFCADDFSEGDRLADAPRTVPEAKKQAAPASSPPGKMESSGDFVMPFGSQKGKKLSEIGAAQVSESLNWVKNKAKPDFAKSKPALEFIHWGTQFLKKTPMNELDLALSKKDLDFDAPQFYVNEPWPEEPPF